MRVEIVSEPAAFSALGACWAKLLANAEGPNSFMSPAWHLSWWEAYAPPARLQVITTYIGDTLVGVAPMMLASERRLGIPIKCLRFIGDGTFVTADHMNFILRQDVAVAVRDAIFDTLGTLSAGMSLSSATSPRIHRQSEQSNHGHAPRACRSTRSRRLARTANCRIRLMHWWPRCHPDSARRSDRRTENSPQSTESIQCAA